MIKTRTWICVILIIAVISAALTLWLWRRPADGTVANIYLDGQCIRSVDLMSVTEPESFTLTSERGENVILIEKGRICVLESDCPDQICVEDGWLSDSASPIVCLPHRLVIELSDKPASGPDAVSR